MAVSIENLHRPLVVALYQTTTKDLHVQVLYVGLGLDCFDGLDGLLSMYMYIIHKIYIRGLMYLRVIETSS